MNPALMEAIKAYREAKTGAVGLVPNPPDAGTDNGLLFSATYMMLAGNDNADDVAWFYQFVTSSWLNGVQGSLSRHPKANEPTDWDDHFGIAAGSRLCWPAQAIRSYGREHWGKWPAGWLWRFPIFAPTVKHCSGRRLWPLGQLLAITAFLGNLFESKDQTSGKCLLYMASRALYGNYFLVDFVLKVWAKRMTKFYGSPKGMYSIYFGADHPFTLYGPDKFLEKV